LAHVIEITEFTDVKQNQNATFTIQDSWAVHQLKTTANFATDNKVISWFVGGLNFQVEHHLFPKISHIHYPALSPIVKRVCAQYDLPYNTIPSMLTAIGSHYRTMRRFGQELDQFPVGASVAA
jgi:linoleoyl-CoA desaturase